MFIGEYHHNLDDKGRLAIPVKFRSLLKGGAVVTRGLDNCLFLYTKEEWHKIAGKLANLPFNKTNDRAMSRHFLAGAMEIDFDGQGRATLPDYLRRFGNLNKKVVIAGLYNRLEIWNEDAWDSYRQETEKESNKIAETLDSVEI